MSKRETPPSPYSEATVVQSRNPAPPPPATTSEGSERTVVQGRSNLKETFDARTVVRTASSFPPEMPTPPKAPAPQIPDAPARVQTTAPAPAPAPVGTVKAHSQPAIVKEPTNPAFEQTGGAVQLSAAAEDKPAKKKKEKAPREPRKPLDQRSKLFIAGFAVVAVLALVFVMGGGETASTSSDPAQASAPATPDQGQESMSSEQPAQGDAAKFQQLAGPPAASTADVLNRFDKASARAQERAEQYSRSGGGF